MGNNVGTNDLSSDEFRKVVSSYDDEGTTSEIYEFGKFLVSESVDRAHHLDSKATTIAGYGGTIVALLVSTSSLWRPTIAGWAVAVIFLGALLSLVAVAVAVRSTTPKKFDWFSDIDWVRQEYLEKPDMLRRYYVLAMHNVVHSHDDVMRAKNRSIGKAQWCLCVSAVLLLVALGNATWRSVSMHSSQSSSGQAASILPLAASAAALPSAGLFVLYHSVVS